MTPQANRVAEVRLNQRLLRNQSKVKYARSPRSRSGTGTDSYPRRYTSSYFTLRHNRSTNTLSRHRPRPSMLTATPAASNRPVHAPAVNGTPWSVLNTFGVPVANASPSMSWQNAPSRVFDSRYATPYRRNQSIVAARYRNPPGSGR